MNKIKEAIEILKNNDVIHTIEQNIILGVLQQAKKNRKDVKNLIEEMKSHLHGASDFKIGRLQYECDKLIKRLSDD